jgi:hypothetical protein
VIRPGGLFENSMHRGARHHFIRFQPVVYGQQGLNLSLIDAAAICIHGDLILAGQTIDGTGGPKQGGYTKFPGHVCQVAGDATPFR